MRLGLVFTSVACLASPLQRGFMSLSEQLGTGSMLTADAGSTQTRLSSRRTGMLSQGCPADGQCVSHGRLLNGSV